MYAWSDTFIELIVHFIVSLYHVLIFSIKIHFAHNAIKVKRKLLVISMPLALKGLHIGSHNACYLY